MEEIERNHLIHIAGQSLVSFLEEIDLTGGWPLGMHYVSFYHSVDHSGRECKFGNRELREPYWTTVASSDDYYWWKLSENKKKEVTEESRRQLIGMLR